MKPLYILDLEGTTGIYTAGHEHRNDTILLRPGFKELAEESNTGTARIAIATRAPRYFVNDILRNLNNLRIRLKCRVYTKEDIEIPAIDDRMACYKDYQPVFEEHKITNPEDESVVIGDFLRFCSFKGYSQTDYMNFDFRKSPQVLFSNFSLNDHPIPVNGKTPVYAVLPQPWTTFAEGVQQTLDLDYVIKYLQELYKIGRNSFKKGLELISGSPDMMSDNQYVRNRTLSEKVLGINHMQDYLIMKGRKENWKPLIKVM